MNTKTTGLLSVESTRSQPLEAALPPECTTRLEDGPIARTRVIKGGGNFTVCRCAS